MQSTPTRIVAIGGGHCNCQMLKLLKKKVLDSAAPMTMTLINESAVSYYSGMLPGTVSKLYTDEDLKIELAPLAKWCGAKYIQERVVKIEGNKNLIHLENGETVEYDVLAVNVGSKTKDTGNIKGVWEHALTTRPINDLIPKIIKKEQELKDKGVVPTVVICGGGAAGTELSFAFKKRWSEFFG
jgi:selenide, water dikinase